jgi:hypothetical protein
MPMTRMCFASFALLCGLAHGSDRVPVKTTVCQLMAKPEEFSGKMVVFQAELVTPQRMALVDDSCGRILLKFPTDDEARPKASFKLIEDDQFKLMMESRSELVPPPPGKPGKILATFEGRFDSVFVLSRGQKVKRDPRSMRLAADEVRLVLRRVSEVKVEQSQ